MNSKVFSQLDSRWSALPYPVRSSSVGGNACGLFAVLHLAIEQAAKASWGPENLRKYMIGKGYAISGQGTTWNGITETLKYIGHKTVVRVWSDPMSAAWKELNKGGRIGIILFNSNRAPNGKRWTSGGHYVAFTDYKFKNGKHYFYIKDSGGRRNTGWYTYENSMYGCIPKLWIVKRIVEKAYEPKTAYTGTTPSPTVKMGSKGAKVKAVQTFLNWAIDSKLAVDGIAGVLTIGAIKQFQTIYGLLVDGIFGRKSAAKAKELIKKYADIDKPVKEKTAGEKATEWAIAIAKSGKYKYKNWSPSKPNSKLCPICHPGSGNGWNCIGFITAAYYHGAGLKFIKCGNSGFGSNQFFERMTEATWRKRNGDKWREVKSMKESKLKPGDVLICFRKNNHKIFVHVAMYAGSGKYIDCTSGRKPNIGLGTYTKLASRYYIRTFRYGE